MTKKNHICLNCGKRFAERHLDCHIEGIKHTEKKVEAETVKAYSHEKCGALIVPFRSKR